MKANLKEILKNVLVLILALASLEAALRLAGAGYLALRDLQQQDKPGAQVILCIGESTTALGLENSYPSLLQKQLDSMYGIKKYKVVNAGRPGTNSTKILSELPELLKEHRPWLVISMLGINDRYKVFGTDKWYSEFRLFKAAEWTIKYLTDQEALQLGSINEELEYHGFTEDEKDKVWLQAREYYAAGKIAEARKQLDHFVELAGAGTRAHLIAAWQDHSQNIRDENTFILRHLENAIKKDSTHVRANWLSGVVYRKLGSFEKSEKFFLRALELKPCDERSVYSLWKQYTQRNLTEKATALSNSCKERLQASGIDDPETVNKRDFRQTDSDLSIFEKNYREIVSLVRGSGAAHAVMQYPMRDKSRLQFVLDEYPGLIYISNLENFQQLQKKHKFDEIFTDRFAGNFGHSTALGNSTIAAQVVTILQQNKLLPANGISATLDK